MNRLRIATKRTITLNPNIKYLAMFGISANLKTNTRVMETNRAIIVPNPALSPNTLIRNTKPASGVSGTEISETDIFSGIANFMMFAIALIENSKSNRIEVILAWIFNPGDLFRMPRPSMAPCKIPIKNTTPYEIKKFSSAIARMSI